MLYQLSYASKLNFASTAAEKILAPEIPRRSRPDAHSHAQDTSDKPKQTIKVNTNGK